MRGKAIFFTILSFAGLIGCTQSVSEIGANFFDRNILEISYLDSITAKAYTVLGDSIITSNATRLLVGYHQDPKLGAVTAKTIFQVGTRVSGTEVDRSLNKEFTEYVSCKLWLKRDGYSFYDTTQTQTLSVFRLTKEMKLFNGYIYNTSDFSIDSNNPLGSVTFTPRPGSQDSLEVPLSDVFGQQLMTMLQNDDPILSNNSDFLQFLKGFAVVPDTTLSRTVMGFNVQPELRVYYRDESTTPSVTRFVSFFRENNFYYNNVHSWREGTNLNSLEDIHDQQSSVHTDHESYLQGGVGLNMRIDLPYLRNFLFEDRNFTFTRTILELMPVNPSLNDKTLPQTLSAFVVNEQNLSISAVPIAGRLVRDLDLGRNTRYEFDITTFVNNQVQNDVINKNGLLLLLDDAAYRSGVNTLTLGDQQNFYKMKVKLYYLTLSNQLN